MTAHGGNELGSGGAPGTYNWSEAESYSFNTVGGFLYIAAWSDDSIAQGLIADILINGNDYSSGHPAWEVYRTNDNRGDNDPHPTTTAMENYVGFADANNLWELPAVGDLNGQQAPWATVAGINMGTARWMWVANPNQFNPFEPGSGFGEMLIFRIAVPTPGAAALMGLGALAATRRRRA
jgi:MYXO-CTERM domain-containing protein